MPFDATARNLRNIKELLLALSVIYFYVLASLLYFGHSTYGLDKAPVFIVMSTLFLIAIGLEILLAWWHRRLFVVWGVIGLAAYGVLGLYVAPILYGPGIFMYVLLEPIIVTLVGGFAFSSGRLIAEQLLPDRALTPEQVAGELKNLPGWKSEGGSLAKSYVFAKPEAALAFVERIGVIVSKTKHIPEIHTSDKTVLVRLKSMEPNAITLKDIHLAQEIDQI